MNKKIEVPVWALVVHGLLTVMLIISLVVVAVVPEMARPALAFLATDTPTVTPTTRPTRTPTPIPTETPIPQPTMEAVVCTVDDVVGVDCPIDVDSIPVVVVAIEWPGEEYVDVYGRRWGPKDELLTSHEVLVIHVALPLGVPPEDAAVWFEDGGSHAPQVEDGDGAVVATIGLAVPWVKGEVSVVTMVFVVPKDATDLFLRIQGDAVVDLTDVSVVGRARQSALVPTLEPTRLFPPR